MRYRRSLTAVAVAALASAALPHAADAALTFTVEPNGWPDQARRDAAVAAMQSVVNRYNAYGNFGNYNVYVYYNAGIPTAQASYLGSIGFGGTYPNERVTMHELGHYLGSGTYGTPWDGARGEALVAQFDGLEATLQGDTQHFWPYGLNYDSEGSEINKQRQVAMIYAQRADMGIGSAANPWSATAVNLTASDPLGESGFNYATRWSDGRFAHPGASYSTGSFLLRTPAGGNSFTFVGESLTVNNTNGINGGLLYKGSGATGVTTFKNLILDGGYVRHASGSGDLFQLAGNVTLSGSPTIDAAQGNVNVLAGIAGSGSLTKTGSFAVTLSGTASYTGDTHINAGTLRLAPVTPVARYSFDDVSGNTVINGGSGGAGMNGTLANGATVVAGGQSGNAVFLAGGGSVDINSPITDLGNQGNWAVSAWVKTAASGSSILTKGSGSGWANGNTIFYLGDGTAGGSGGIPSGVRYAGGFYQGSTGATAVNDNIWHHVTYVNSGGVYAIYVDGVPQPLSAGNSGFGTADIGSVVRLGVSTNTVAGDGTLNFNGLMDGVQFFNQALSATQVAALYQGGSTSGALPSTTNVSIAAGATLDVNGVAQTIGSLAGPSGSAVTLGAGRLTVSSASNAQFGGSLSGTGGITKAGTGTLTLSGASTYSGGTTVSAGTLVLGNADATGGGPINVVDGALARAQAALPKAVTMTTLSTHTTGKFDLTDNSMLVRNMTVAQVQALVQSAFAAGNWDGPAGLTSSTAAAASTKATAIGFAGNSILNKTSFKGVAPLTPTDVLVKYTYYGDADLSGTTTLDDFTLFLNGYQNAGNTWVLGDFDYSGLTTLDDFTLFLKGYQQQGAPLIEIESLINSVAMSPSERSAMLAAVAAVPEPTGAALLGMGALATLRRRIRAVP
jgi:autotransporter-associated beta strand protein